MPQFSANLGFLWGRLPLCERIERAARAGFAAVELHWPYDTPAEAVRESCGTNGVALLGINTPFGDAGAGEFGLAALPGREDDFARSFEMTVAYARAAGARHIHVLAGVVPADRREAARPVLVANLRRAAEIAPDLMLVIEPLNARDRPDYFYARAGEAIAVIEEVGAPNLRLMFDAYHVGMMGEDVGASLASALPHVGHVQIAAVPSRAEPDEGKVDYRAFFADLDRLGYAGWVGCEYVPRGDTDEGLSWMRTLLSVPAQQIE